MIDLTPLRPILLTAVVLAGVALLADRSHDRRWALTLAVVGAVQLVGYALVARMVYASGELAAIQIVFAAVATAVFTKVVVFSPALVVRVFDPELEPALGLKTLGTGLVASWLIQASLALLFLFPDSVLRAAVAWAHPGSPLFVYSPPLLAGAVLAQVTLSRALYEPPARPRPASSDLPVPAATATDGGRAGHVPVLDQLRAAGVAPTLAGSLSVGRAVGLVFVGWLGVALVELVLFGLWSVPASVESAPPSVQYPFVVLDALGSLLLWVVISTPLILLILLDLPTGRRLFAAVIGSTVVAAPFGAADRVSGALQHSPRWYAYNFETIFDGAMLGVVTALLFGIVLVVPFLLTLRLGARLRKRWEVFTTDD